MSATIADVDESTLRKLLNVGAAFAAFQVAVDVLERTSFDDEDMTTIAALPLGLRAHTTARLIDATEALREELKGIDGRLLLLTSGLVPGSTGA